MDTTTFGFDLALFLLGMAGGLIRSIVNDKVGLRQGIVNMIVGGLTANYFTTFIAKKTGMVNQETIFAAAIIVGFFAVGVFVLLNSLEQWAKKNPTKVLAIIITHINTVLTKVNINTNDVQNNADDATG